MNEAQIHLAVNHFPVTGLFLATLVWIGALIFKSDGAKKTALLLFILASIATFPTYFSGEGAEELVEDQGGFDHHIIHEHEEAAEPFMIVMSILGSTSLAIFTLFWLKRVVPRWLIIVQVVFALFCCTVAGRVAHTGGLIKHPEISGGTSSSEKGE